MAVVISINGTDRSSQVEWKSFNWRQNLTDKADTLKFTMNVYGATKSTKPAKLDIITVSVDGSQVFGGVILQSTGVTLAPGYEQYKVTAKDYTHLFDRLLVVERYVSKPIKNVICDILNRYVNKGSRVEIATFEDTEVWTGGTVDTTNYRLGDQAMKLTSTNTAADSMYRDILVNLAQDGYTTADLVEVDVYVDNVDNLDTCTLTLGDSDLTNYYSAEVSSQITQSGWNLVSLAQSGFSETGTMSWETIARIKIEVVSQASVTVNCTFDNWQLVKTSAFRRDNVSDDAPTINYIIFNYEPPSTVLKRLANRFQWEWYIDSTKDIHFFRKFDKIAPFDLSDTNAKYVFRSLVIDEQSDQIRNSIYVRGGDYLAPTITEDLSHQADGTNKIFKLGYKYANYSLQVNSVVTPVGVLNLQEYADNPGESQISDGGTSLNMGDTSSNEKISQEVLVAKNGRRGTVTLRVKKVGSPADNLQIQIFPDDGSNKPDTGALSTVTTLAGGTITTDFVEYTFAMTETSTGDLNFAVGDKYHIVINRSTAVDASNYFVIDAVASGAYQGLVHSYDGATWNSESASLYFTTFVDYDALYSYNEKILVFSTAPSAMDTLEWTADPYLPVIVQYRKITSIQDVGEYQHRILDPTIKTKEAARERAEEELLAYADSLKDLTYTTHTDGLVAGQTQNVQSDLRSLDLNIIIKSITATCNTPTELVYRVTGSLTRNMDLVYWMQEQIQKDNRQIIVDEDEQLDKIEFLSESFEFVPEYDYTLYVGKYWSNDAGTTPDKLEWDGGAAHIWV